MDSQRHARPYGGYAWGQAEQAGAVEGRLCSIKKEWHPPIPTEGCDWLMRIILLAGMEWKPLTQAWQALCPVPLIRSVVWQGDLIHKNRVGRGTCS